MSVVDKQSASHVGVDAGGVRPILEAHQVAKWFETPRGRLKVIDDVSLAVAPGEAVAIVGASGTGKSTLLHILGGLDEPSAGSVSIDGAQLGELGQGEARFRNQTVGFVFQFHHLLPEFTAVENVMMPALISGLTPAGARDRALELLELVGLAERAAHQPGELSGGEQQRVAVARALCNRPRVLLADEPTGSLDPRTSLELQDLLTRVRRDLRQTLVMVTHDRGLADRADRVLELTEGRLFAAAGPDSAGGSL